jgi:hypothetical protein
MLFHKGFSQIAEVSATPRLPRAMLHVRKRAILPAVLPPVRSSSRRASRDVAIKGNQQENQISFGYQACFHIGV